MDLEVLYEGRKVKLSAIVDNNRCLIKDFLDSIDDRRSKAQMLSLLQYVSDNGPPFNEQKFRHLSGKIYELKTRTGLRILCFWSETNSLILTHGFFKGERLQREIKKALKYSKDF